jgi:hypothetical protein
LKLVSGSIQALRLIFPSSLVAVPADTTPPTLYVEAQRLDLINSYTGSTALPAAATPGGESAVADGLDGDTARYALHSARALFLF